MVVAHVTLQQSAQSPPRKEGNVNLMTFAHIAIYLSAKSLL